MLNDKAPFTSIYPGKDPKGEENTENKMMSVITFPAEYSNYNQPSTDDKVKLELESLGLLLILKHQEFSPEEHPTPEEPVNL